MKDKEDRESLCELQCLHSRHPSKNLADPLPHTGGHLAHLTAEETEAQGGDVACAVI